ncbi:MAG: SDR family oxidoreductase [Desulfonatronovibrionaceae bacterium]
MSEKINTSDKPVLILGGTGYVGGRLIPLLLSRGINVRAAVRTPKKLACRPFASSPGLETVKCDVLDRDSLLKASTGCRAAYYLVHSMSGKDHSQFAKKDRKAAENMVHAADKATMSQLIYLGGLGDANAELSPHLKSRLEVGKVLGSGNTPLTFLRAAMILGAGSASFEILRHLADRLPIMITPRWVHTQCQPIAISTVLRYLADCLDHPLALGKNFDIGGPDILTYAKLFQLYAKVAGLHKRIIIPVPFLTPGLSSRWIHMVTPVPASMARPLAEGLSNTVVCRENEISKISPEPPISCREAISRAIGKNVENTDTCWSDAGLLETPEWLGCSDATYAGPKIMQSNHYAQFEAEPEDIWPVLTSLGGENGWLFAGILWKIRGFADRIIGGSGLHRGRRQPGELRIGDALDFWRVLEIVENKELTLIAEMKLPGEAILSFDPEKTGDKKTVLRQKSSFAPRGLAGIVYWYSLLPFHSWIFKGMLRKIAEKSKHTIISGPNKLNSFPGSTCKFI